jgi:hypothetical protein
MKYFAMLFLSFMAFGLFAQMEKLVEIKSIFVTDTLFIVKEKGFVNFIKTGSGSDKSLYKPTDSYVFCYVGVIVKKVGEGQFTLDLDRIKLVDQNNNEHSVFGITATNFKEITYNTRTTYSGGKTASIDLAQAYQSNANYINLHQIIRPYNLGGNTLSFSGGISITGEEQGTITVSCAEHKNTLTFSKTPSVFTVVFIVPAGITNFELKFDRDAYFVKTAISTSGRNILEYNEKTRQVKGGSQLVFTNKGVKPVEVGDIFFENSVINNQTLKFNKITPTNAIPGAILKGNEKESFEVVEIFKNDSKTTVYPTNCFKLVTEEQIYGNMNSVLTTTREYGTDTIERKLTISKYQDYEVFKNFGNAFNDPQLKELSNKDFMVKSEGDRYVIASIENPLIVYDLLVVENQPKLSTLKQESKVKPEALVKDKNLNIIERWPHKKTKVLEIGYLAGLETIGENETLIADEEDDFLKSLGLIWQETQNGSVTSSKPIDTYAYSGGAFIGGIRFSYYLSNKLALGGSFRFYKYTQSLTIGKDVAQGDFIDLKFVGPNFNYSLYNRKRFGLTLKADLAMVTGNLQSVPALKILNDKNLFSGISGYTNLINNRNRTTTVSGFHFNAGVSANWFIARWFNIDAGLHLNYLQAEASQNIWSSSNKSFNTISVPIYFGLNFLINNK